MARPPLRFGVVYDFRNAPGSGQWHFNLSTDRLELGSYLLTIRVAERKDYVAGFVLGK